MSVPELPRIDTVEQPHQLRVLLVDLGDDFGVLRAAAVAHGVGAVPVRHDQAGTAVGGQVDPCEHLVDLASVRCTCGSNGAIR